MPVLPGRGRSRLRLGLLIFTAVAFMTLDFRDYEPLEKLQSGVRDLLHPVISVGNSGLNSVSDVWAATFGGSHLRRVNYELRAEIDRLEGAAIQDETVRETYRQALEAIDIDYITDIERLTALVLRDNTGNFNDNTIVIDKGHSDGLVPGMAVVTGAGMVGTIRTVGADHSIVTTISNPELTISVRLVSTNEVGLGHGVAGDHTRFVVDTGLRWPEVDPRAHLAEIGSPVITAATSRYPANIPIGRIESVESAKAGLVQIVTIELAVDTGDLNFITVLLEEPDDLPPSNSNSPFGDITPMDNLPPANVLPEQDAP
ncbi:MAG: rod shape-determining protein MreC [Acidimicrobiaceae bacterium]|nr:rod shape-determining protein MreC [Acidimicrobiaceae bacterium]